MNSLGANYTEYARTVADENVADWTWCARKRAAIVGVLNVQSGGRLADVGCRSGHEAMHYGTSIQAREVHGFEIDDAPLVTARRRGVIGHVWVSGEGPCPVEDNFFDVVVVGDVIEHLFDPDTLVSELFRVTRPGGRVVFTTPNLAWWWSRLRFVFGKPPAGLGGVSTKRVHDRALDVKHLRVSTASEWTNLLRHHGFDVSSRVGFNYPRLLRFPFRVIDDALVRMPTLAHSLLFAADKPA